MLAPCFCDVSLTLAPYRSQVGFLVALQDQLDWSEQGVLTNDFKFIFTEAGKSFFKNADVRDLDESIGDLDAVSTVALRVDRNNVHVKSSKNTSSPCCPTDRFDHVLLFTKYIKDTEALILAELEDDILDCECELRGTFNALAELDCILAFSDCAINNKYVRPEVVPAVDNCIQILNGRHPLQEIVMDTEFIPNNTYADASNRVNIITGPNFSGKSCYARQVGVLAFMAHIGCFIPCDAARISILDQILARFSSVETCAVPQSSFQLDLTQMGSILRRTTPNSLVVSIFPIFFDRTVSTRKYLIHLLTLSPIPPRLSTNSGKVSLLLRKEPSV
jgi:MutS domain V